MDNLLENGAEVDSIDSKNMTPLHYAAMRGHLGIIHSLIQYQATIDAKCESLDTPLSLACTKGHIDAMKVIMGYGADYTLRHKMKNTLLHIGKN